MRSTKQIEINCSPEHLWEVLTQSSYTTQYMFNCSVNSTWKAGAEVIWQGEYNGHKAFQKGKVLNISQGKQLTYSTFDPNFGLPDVAESYIHVTYTLHDINGSTQLTINNETFDGSSERMSHIKQGWEMVIGKIKEVAEVVNV